MSIKTFIFVLGLLAVASATNIASRRVIEASHSTHVPAGWKKLGKVSVDEPLHLTFALKQQNLDKLQKVFFAVSDPESPSYGKYLTGKEVNQLVAPSQETVNVVSSWLSQNGAKNIDNTLSDYLEVDLPAHLAESLLQTEFHWFQHEKSGFKLVRSDREYSLPVEVARHVDLVGGVKRFPQVKDMLQGADAQTRSSMTAKLAENVRQQKEKLALQQDDAWSFWVDPYFLRDLYNVGSASGSSKNNSMAVAQFLEQYFSTLDLNEFFVLFYREAIGNQPTVIGPNPSGAGTEASLDIEYIMALGANVPTTFWSNAGREANQEPFLKWMTDVGKTEHPPLLFSVSYGDDEDSLSFSYTERVNTEFQKQGARGISILFASGDDGVGGDGRGCTKFVPNYPASSPYVTAVGATQCSGIISCGAEQVASLSGGGFSNYFPRQPWQALAVQKYLNKMDSNLPDSRKWNSTGRAYPDVSAQGVNYVIVINLLTMPGVAGTSCATPVFSGVMALLNDLRLNNGKPPLGFLNPLLYKLAIDHPTSFNDITQGSNPGCGTIGFPATTGWDPASGLGTPNYGEMAKYILQY